MTSFLRETKCASSNSTNEREKFQAAVFVAGKCEMENQSSGATELKSSCRSSKLGPLADLYKLISPAFQLYSSRSA